MKGWKDDKCWSDKFLPEIKAILGGALISEAPIEDDQERGTDLMILTMAPFRIGCRIRRYDYYRKYGGQFTIRQGRPSGFKTELTKIIEGWGDYFFYGFSDENENALYAWGLGDLKVFRGWFMRTALQLCGQCPGQERKNGDQSSSFRAFMWDELPTEFVVSQTNLPLLTSRLREVPCDDPDAPWNQPLIPLP